MADTVVENTPHTAPLKRADANSNIMVDSQVDSPKIPEFRIRSSEYCESFSQAKILYQENKIPDVLTLSGPSSIFYMAEYDKFVVFRRFWS